jgi:hypothetical protein
VLKRLLHRRFLGTTTGNILWCALTDIRRKPAVTAVLFALASLAAVTLLFVLLAERHLAVPDVAAFERFFSAFTIVVSAADGAVLISIGLCFARSKTRETAVFRIHGAKKTDILFLNAVELLIPAFAGSLTGALLVMLALAIGAFDLPHVFAGHKGVALVGTAGQVVFGVPLVEIAFASAVTGRLLRLDDGDIARGAH